MSYVNSNNMKAIAPYLATNLTVLISNGWNHTRDLGQLSLNLLCEMNGLSKHLKIIDGNTRSTNVPTTQKTTNPASSSSVTESKDGSKQVTEEVELDKEITTLPAKQRMYKCNFSESEGHHDKEEKVEFQSKTKYDKYLAKMIAEDDDDESEDIPESKAQTEKIGMAESGPHLLVDWMRRQRRGVEQLRCGARGEGIATNDLADNVAEAKSDDKKDKEEDVDVKFKRDGQKDPSEESDKQEDDKKDEAETVEIESRLVCIIETNIAWLSNEIIGNCISPK